MGRQYPSKVHPIVQSEDKEGQEQILPFILQEGNNYNVRPPILYPKRTIIPCTKTQKDDTAVRIYLLFINYLHNYLR